MAWLARLDSNASRWSTPLRWSYLFVKWNLIALGTTVLIGLGIEDIQQRTPGIGLAFLVYLAFQIPTAIQHVRDWSRHH